MLHPDADELHPDAEELVDAAIAGDPGAEVASHVRACADCEAAVADYRHLHALLADADETTIELEDPPPGLWPRIAAAIAADEARSSQPPPAPVELHAASSAQAAGPAHDDSPPRASGPTRGFARVWLAAAAVAGLGVGLLGGYALWNDANAPQSGNPTAIASAELETLDSLRQRGNATVTRSAQSVDLAVTTEQFDPEGGYLEVWLINRDLTRMISVGVLPGDQRQASFPISEELLAQGYTVVDISREEFDDNPLHSGDSIVRGELPI